MARQCMPLLLAAIHWGHDRGFAFKAANLPVAAAQKFAQRAPRKWPPREETLPGIHHKSAPHRSTSRQGRSLAVPATRLEIKKSGSGDDSLDAASFVGKSKQLYLPLIALACLSLVTLGALTGHLPGAPIDSTAPPPFFSTLPFGVLFSGACDPYSRDLIGRDLFSTMLTIFSASIFVKGITYPAKLGKIESRDSRKIIHTLSAPLFIFLWPLFSKAYGARVFASVVPLLNAVRIFAAGNDLYETELAGAISRSGNAKEALGGPLIYVLVLLLSTLLFWTDSPVGVVAASTMAVGDGLADLVGRRFGSSNKWFFNKEKSIAGSAAFVAGSFVGSFGLITWLTATGTLHAIESSTMVLAGRLIVIAIICAGVELLPIGDDNWTVPMAAAILSVIFLDY